MVLVLGSTLCLLTAVEDGRTRWWWAAYAACTCAAVYTHYTSVFALAGSSRGSCGRTRPRAGPRSPRRSSRRSASLPWLSGLRGDLDSPTTDILSALRRSTFGYVESSLVHWAIGFPYLLRGHLGARAARASRRSWRSRSRSPSGSPASPPRRCAGACGARPHAGARDRARRLGAGRQALAARSARTSSGRATWPPRGPRSRSASPRCWSPPGHGSASPRPRWRSARSRSAASRCSTATTGGPSTRRRSRSRPQRGAAATSWSTG